jgi:hypothetical protein
VKQYTKKEYLECWPNGEAVKTPRSFSQGNTRKSPGYCSCVRYLETGSMYVYGTLKPGFVAAWEACPNCLGYGVAPIPWCELK